MRKKFLFAYPSSPAARAASRQGKNWFFEVSTESPTLTWGVLIEKEIYSGKSKYQKIEIFDTKEFGRILALDGLVQLSTKYEFVYHQMLTHPAFLYHSNSRAAAKGAKRTSSSSLPSLLLRKSSVREEDKSSSTSKNILILGGGDGGVLREAVKYPVKEIFLVDMDKKVIDISKKYLSSVSGGAFQDKRLKIFNENALRFVKNYKNYFDIIINDLTDPNGHSLALWQARFYKDILGALKENGVAAFQTALLKEKFAKRTRKKLKQIFPFLKIHKAFVGCFPFNEHTFSFGSKKIDFDKISFKKIKERYKKFNLQALGYYSPEIHFSSAALPKDERS